MGSLAGHYLKDQRVLSSGSSPQQHSPFLPSSPSSPRLHLGSLLLRGRVGGQNMNKHVCRTFTNIYNHKGETLSTVRGCDLQLLLLVMPFVLDNIFQNEVAEWNARHPAAEHVEDLTHGIHLVGVQLLDWYALARNYNASPFSVEIPFHSEFLSPLNTSNFPNPPISALRGPGLH
jgi:hypothetical protein